MSPGLLQDIGALVKAAIGNVPLSVGAQTRTGTGIDRQGYQSAVLIAVVGAGTTPVLDAKIQDSADNSTFADYTDPSTGALAAVAQITTINTIAKKAVNLSKAKRYIRVSETTTGTAVLAGEVVVLGGADTLPVA